MVFCSAISSFLSVCPSHLENVSAAITGACPVSKDSHRDRRTSLLLAVHPLLSSPFLLSPAYTSPQGYSLPASLASPSTLPISGDGCLRRWATSCLG